mmetsp:Transcript_5225/g.16804  ORF Transcript_5225/g.16804 Transcript_5225/m.16804 type:complete len:241 (-) Transcript_5225:949-1671(-)
MARWRAWLSTATPGSPPSLRTPVPSCWSSWARRRKRTEQEVARAAAGSAVVATSRVAVLRGAFASVARTPAARRSLSPHACLPPPTRTRACMARYSRAELTAPCVPGVWSGAAAMPHPPPRRSTRCFCPANRRTGQTDDRWCRRWHRVAATAPRRTMPRREVERRAPPQRRAVGRSFPSTSRVPACSARRVRVRRCRAQSEPSLTLPEARRSRRARCTLASFCGSRRRRRRSPSAWGCGC